MSKFLQVKPVVKKNREGREFRQQTRAALYYFGISQNDLAKLIDSNPSYVRACLAANYSKKRPKWAKLLIELHKLKNISDIS